MAFLGEGWSLYLFKEDSGALALGLKPQGLHPSRLGTQFPHHLFILTFSL